LTFAAILPIMPLARANSGPRSALEFLSVQVGYIGNWMATAAELAGAELQAYGDRFDRTL
jgi:hypothetical protein